MKHTISRLTMLACIALLLGGCWSTSQIPLAKYPPLSHANAITTSAGTTIQFDRSGASVVHDTLRASSAAGPVVIPADSVNLVSVRSFSWGRAIGLYLGLGAVAMIATAGQWEKLQGR